MFPDEHRPEEELRQQYMDYRLSDPKDLFIKYEGLLSRNAKLESEISKLTGQSHGGTSRDKAKWDAERRDLLRKLGEAHGALKIYREGYWKQREELSELRNSRSMRIGRAITSPYQRLKALGNGSETRHEIPEESTNYPQAEPEPAASDGSDRKSTRLNSS